MPKTKVYMLYLSIVAKFDASCLVDDGTGRREILATHSSCVFMYLHHNCYLATGKTNKKQVSMISVNSCRRICLASHDTIQSQKIDSAQQCDETARNNTNARDTRRNATKPNWSGVKSLHRADPSKGAVAKNNTETQPSQTKSQNIRKTRRAGLMSNDVAIC